MATRTRDSAPGKEKRGTSPSQLPNTGTTQRRRSPNPSKTNSPARSHESTASEKRIPNYLKPTVSSGLDVSKQQGKKPASSSDSTHKPTLARRRSFDKPPSPSRTQKSRVSPSPTLRSSSFSGKTITSQKVVPDKNLKAPKDAGKQHTLYARPVNTAKKSSIYIKKQETGSGSSTTKEQVNIPPEKVDNPNIPDVPEPETQSKDQEPSIAEAEEQTYEKEAEDSLLEDQEPINIEQTEGESEDKDAKIVTHESSTISENQDAKIVTVESPTVLEHQDAKIATVESSAVSEHQDVSLGVKTEKPEDKSHIEEISSKQQEIKEDTINEMSNINTDESVAGNPNEEVEEKEREEEATALNKKEEAASGSEAHESKETEVQVVLEEKPVNVVPKTQVAHGKKDSAVSNDVIEETANKLREQRKNKVKALAGAFETVISLQEPK